MYENLNLRKDTPSLNLIQCVVSLQKECNKNPIKLKSKWCLFEFLKRPRNNRELVSSTSAKYRVIIMRELYFFCEFKRAYTIRLHSWIHSKSSGNEITQTPFFCPTPKVRGVKHFFVWNDTFATPRHMFIKRQNVNEGVQWRREARGSAFAQKGTNPHNERWDRGRVGGLGGLRGVRKAQRYHKHPPR